MRTNGFIFIALSLTATALAGSPGYLSSVGPLALRFEREAAAGVVGDLPVPSSIGATTAGSVSREDFAAELTPEVPAEAAPPTLMHDAPVALPLELLGTNVNALQALIGPMMDTNGVVTPQMLLRFFTPPQGGVSREAILVVPPGFNPARPPTPSSTATYSQPKP